MANHTILEIHNTMRLCTLATVYGMLSIRHALVLIPTTASTPHRRYFYLYFTDKAQTG